MRKKSVPVVDAAQASLFPAEPGASPTLPDVPPSPAADARLDGVDAPATANLPVPLDPQEDADRVVLAAEPLLATLADWAERGWIRRLDAALARFVAGFTNEAGAGPSSPALLAIALTAHLEGRGHACVSIDELVTAPETLLAWKPEALAALLAVLAAMPGPVEQWTLALSACAVVCADERSPDRGRPLVLRQGRLYLRRYWDYECRVAAQVRRRAAALGPVDDEPAARAWLDRLFPARSAARPSDESVDESVDESLDGSSEGAPDWQKIACAVALRGRFTVITGGPGTGKTHTAARLLALLFAMTPDRTRLRVALAAPTGKAAARLKQSIDGALASLHERVGADLSLAEFAASLGAAKTLHSLLGARPDTRHFRHDAAHPLEVDVLIVDEASMVHLEMMAALLDALPAAARIVLLGDKDQLASVEAGAVLGELCRGAEQVRYTADTARHLAALAGRSIPARFIDETGSALAQRTVMLRASHRFGGAIGALARAVNAGDAAAARELLNEGRSGPVCWLPSATPAAIVDLAAAGRSGAPGGYRSCLEAIARRPRGNGIEAVDAWARDVLEKLDRFRVLCAVREGAWGVVDLNRAIEMRLREEGGLSGGSEWYEGRPVIVTRNDRALGVFNGDIGIALRPSADAPALRAYFVDGDAVRSVAVGRLADVETAFAMTVHKSQGSEFDHTVLVLPAEAGVATSRELIYTGITRARSALTVVSASPAALTSGIAQTARRSSGLYGLLQEKG